MLHFDNLTLGYERHPAVHHLHASVQAGDLLAVVGPNGAGKSTLMKGIMGELKPLQGKVRLEGVERRDVAYLPQLCQIDRSFPVSVKDMIAMGAWRHTGAFGRLKRTHHQAVANAIQTLGLEGFEQRAIGSLSGGQLQRVLFARLLVQDAQLILLDEPFTAIDSRTTKDLLSLVLDWHQQGRTVVAVLHDLDQVRKYFPRTLLLSRETVALGDTRQVLSQENLSKALQLHAAFENFAPVCEQCEEQKAKPKDNKQQGAAA